MLTTIILDMDGVIAESRQKASKKMITLLAKLSYKYGLAVISGGTLSLMKYQFLNQFDRLDCYPKLYLFPTSGTQCFTYTFQKEINVYSEELDWKVKEKIIEIVSEFIKNNALLWDNIITYDVIEDRGSQITWSALGRSAPLKLKKNFDPDGIIRTMWKKELQKRLPNINITIGGTTSLDFTTKKIDKSYGVKKLIEMTGINKSEILFFGDKLKKGGNDYPVKKMGINCVEVKNPEDAYRKLKELL